MSPIISVIIPCYNSGKYLLEAIDSVVNYNHKHSYEIVITDDGSTDPDTILLLKSLIDKGFNIIQQENKGPGSARNTSVKNAKGDYLLFLDSDNKITGSYIDKGIDIFQNNEEIGVVYANPTFFGTVHEDRVFSTQPFNLSTLIAGNYIDMCSIVRKKAFEDVGGFDEERILIGHEDWEFWIRVAKAGWKFFHINEELFYYRIMPGSLITSTNEDNKEKYEKKSKYIFKKHLELLVNQYADMNYRLTIQNAITEDYKNRPLRSFLKVLYNKYLK